jgi:hypothetical protein
MKKYPALETISLIAVFAGLVFVGLEIRQNNRPSNTFGHRLELS